MTVFFRFTRSEKAFHSRLVKRQGQSLCSISRVDFGIIHIARNGCVINDRCFFKKNSTKYPSDILC